MKTTESILHIDYLQVMEVESYAGTYFGGNGEQSEYYEGASPVTGRY